MNTFIALFRGINVGGKNLLPMKDLVALMEDQNFQGIRTYIQSGNVVFQSKSQARKKVAQTLSEAVERDKGFKPHVILLSLDELRSAVAKNPFPQAEKDPKSLHLFFLSQESKNPDLELLKSCASASESFEAVGPVFYLHAPEGIGRSKLATKVEKALGVSGTGRNWRSVTKVLALAEKED